MKLLWLLASSKGRISRGAWWGSCVVLLATMVGAMIALVLTVGRSLGSEGAVLLAIGGVWVASLVPYYFVSVKRLHDTKDNGTWFTVYLVVTTAAVVVQGSFVVSAMSSGPASISGPAILEMMFSIPGRIVAAIGAISQLVGLYYFYALGFQPGTVGENQFGADPARLRPDPLRSPGTTGAK